MTGRARDMTGTFGVKIFRAACAAFNCLIHVKTPSLLSLMKNEKECTTTQQRLRYLSIFIHDFNLHSWSRSALSPHPSAFALKGRQEKTQRHEAESEGLPRQSQIWCSFAMGSAGKSTRHELRKVQDMNKILK